MKIKIILEQLRIALFNRNGYPSAYLFNYWESCVSKDGKTVYKHFKTLYNYITNKKTVYGKGSCK